MQCNRNKLAAILGYDVKTVDRMVRDGLPYVSRPAAGKGSWVFDTADVLRWMARDELTERNKASKLRLAEAKAGLKWLEYGEALGILASRHDVLPKLEEAMQIAKSRMLAVPGRFEQLLAVESDPDVIEKMLREEIEEIFRHADDHAKAGIESLAKSRTAATAAGRR